MPRKRKPLKAHVYKALFNRSGGRCECCGVDIVVDKHHIQEFAKGGPDIESNILCLCTTCHRIIPSILKEDDQKYIQTLNFSKRSDTFSFFSDDTVFEVGATKFENVGVLWKFRDKHVIYPYKINGRTYVNVVMLENFDPYLLVIGNRVIYGSFNVTAVSKPNSLEIRHGDERLLRIEEVSGRIKIYLKFRFKGMLFDFSENATYLPGGGHFVNVSIEDTDVGINFNM